MNRKRKLAGLVMVIALTTPAGVSADPGMAAVDRMDSAVRSAAGISATSPASKKVRPAPLRADAQGRVMVYVEGDNAETLRQAVNTVGGIVSDVDRRRIRAAVAPSALERLARAPGVQEVRRPETPTELAITSEGVQPSSASAWHADGKQGAGVKVGILDVGFARFDEALANGELPAGTTVYNGLCGAGHASSHGTTMAEVVHDMAPQAQLYLACVTDSMDFDDAARWLKDQGVRVVSLSIAFPGTGRGDGLPDVTPADWSPATVVAWLRGNGIVVVAGAGNEANKHMTGRTADPENNGWMNISGAAENQGFSTGAGTPVTVELRWDAWPRTNHDLDVFVMDELGRPEGPNDPHIVARSTRPQKETAGGLTPVETVSFTSTLQQTYWVYIQRKEGALQTLRYDLTIHGNVTGVAYVVSAGSIAEPATSPYALAVGAITPINAAAGGVEDYSSRGPTIDGRIKPDLAGFTNVSSYTGGVAPGTTRSGTSIAAAHVSGAAALYKSANPALDPAELEAQLLDSSRRPGRDNTLGYGVLNLGAPRVPQPPSGNGFTALATPRRVMNTNDGTGGHQGMMQPGETFTLRVPDLPPDATAVSLAVIARSTSNQSLLELFADTPTGTSTVDVLPGRDNQVLVAVTLHPQDKIVRIHNTAASAHVVVDLLGYFSPSSPATYFPLQRSATLFDTRTLGGTTPKISNGEVHTVRVRGVAGVPTTATSAVINVSGSEASATSTLELYAQNPVNHGVLSMYDSTDRLTKLTVVPIGDDGAIRIRGRGADAHAAIDLVGWFGGAGGAKYVPLRYTERAFDTVTGSYTHPMWFGSQQTREFRIALQPRVPVDASAVWLTVRATSSSRTPTSIRLWPREYPSSGHVQLWAQWYTTSGGFSTGAAQQNGVLLPLGTTGVLGIYNELGTAVSPIRRRGAPDVTIGLQGYFVGGTAVPPAS